MIASSRPSSARTVIRTLAGVHRPAPLVVLDGDAAPERTGARGYHTTPSGKTIVHHPNAYGWRTVYHPSTLRVTVGRGWLRAQALGAPGVLRSAALSVLAVL